MTKADKILGLNRASGESVYSFRNKLIDVFAQYGYAQDGHFEEQKGAVHAFVYSGADDQFLVCKFPVSEADGARLGWNEDSGPHEGYDAFISLKNVPSYIAEDFAQDLAHFDEKKADLDDILGVLKEPAETRDQFRKRLEDFLWSEGFVGGDLHISEEGDILYKFYENGDGQKIDVTYAGDNIADTHGFDYRVQGEFYPYSSNVEDLADAAIMFEEVPDEIRKRIHQGLEDKFTL